MKTEKTIGSYFNPCSLAHDAMTNFKRLSCPLQVGIGAVVTLLAISILFVPFAVPVFRILNERCQVQPELTRTDARAQNVYNGLGDVGDSEPLSGMPQTTIAPQRTLDDLATYVIKEKAVLECLKGSGLLEADINALARQWSPENHTQYIWDMIKYLLEDAVLKSETEQYKRDYAQLHEKTLPTKSEIDAALYNKQASARRRERVNELVNLLAQHAERFVAPAAVARLTTLDNDKLYTLSKKGILLVLNCTDLLIADVNSFKEKWSNQPVSGRTIVTDLSDALLRAKEAAYTKSAAQCNTDAAILEQRLKADVHNSRAAEDRSKTAKKLRDSLAVFATPVQSMNPSH